VIVVDDNAGFRLVVAAGCWRTTESKAGRSPPLGVARSGSGVRRDGNLPAADIHLVGIRGSSCSADSRLGIEVPACSSCRERQRRTRNDATDAGLHRLFASKPFARMSY